MITLSFYFIKLTLLQSITYSQSICRQLFLFIVVTCQIWRKSCSEGVPRHVPKSSTVWLRQQKYLVIQDCNVDNLGEWRVETHKLTRSGIHNKNSTFKVTENQLLVENEQLREMHGRCGRQTLRWLRPFVGKQWDAKRPVQISRKRLEDDRERNGPDNVRLPQTEVRASAVDDRILWLKTAGDEDGTKRTKTTKQRHLETNS